MKSPSTRGPIPKRDSERAGHRSPDERPDVIQTSGRVRIPRVDGKWHPDAKAWFTSLRRSAMSRFYEESDWRQAKIVANMLSSLLQMDSPSATLWKTVNDEMDKLGVTEGARRRLRIEIDRGPKEKPDKPKASQKFTGLKAVGDGQ